MAVAHSIAADLTNAVIDGLAVLFAGQSEFNGLVHAEQATSVSYGFNFGSKSAEQVYLGRMNAETPPAGLRAGRNYRDESGSFDITVLVRLPGLDASATIRRLFTIGHQIEDWIGERKSGEDLGITGLQTLLIESWTADYAGIDSGTGAILTYTVAWKARLDDSVTP